MIIDVHSHFWSGLEQLGPEIAETLRTRGLGRVGRLEVNPSAHDKAMTCVDASLVFSFRSDRLGARVPVELIAEFVGGDPQRRIGIGGIDPMSPDSIDQVESVIKYGLAGISVSPALSGFHPAHSSAMRVYERCAETGMPVFVTTIEPMSASAVLEFARPALWDEVAQSFPHLPIVISHLGYPWIDETLVLLGKHPNVYANIAGIASRPWQLYTTLFGASGLGVMDKLMFASGFPFNHPAKVIEALYSINAYSHGTHLPSIPRSQIRGIVERDSLMRLGIEADIPARKASPVIETSPFDLDELAEQTRRYSGGE